MTNLKQVFDFSTLPLPDTCSCTVFLWHVGSVAWVWLIELAAKLFLIKYLITTCEDFCICMLGGFELAQALGRFVYIVDQSDFSLGAV